MNFISHYHDLKNEEYQNRLKLLQKYLMFVGRNHVKPVVSVNFSKVDPEMMAMFMHFYEDRIVKSCRFNEISLSLGTFKQFDFGGFEIKNI